MNHAAETIVDWHRLTADAVLALLDSDAQKGLSVEEAATRLTRIGPNTLAAGRQRSLIRMFFSQFADFMILVLLAAAVISGVIGEPMDTIAILAILV